MLTERVVEIVEIQDGFEYRDRFNLESVRGELQSLRSTPRTFRNTWRYNQISVRLWQAWKAGGFENIPADELMGLEDVLPIQKPR